MKKYKDRTKNLLMRFAGHLKPFILVGAILVIFSVTGFFSSVSYLGSSALLATGFANADDQVDAATDFDFQFTVKDLKDNRFPFDQFKGKVIFLNMWATWCGPCRAEMKGIQKLYDKVDHEKIAFVLLSIDRDKDKGKVIDYLDVKGFTFPVYMPTGYLSEQLQNVNVIPTTFLISKEGKIVKSEVGSTNFNTSKFQKLLGQLSQ